MKEQTAAFLQKSCSLLERAAKMHDIGLYEDAGRAAYLAGLHAAQALIHETNGKATSSHKGVHRALGRLMKDEPRFDHELRRFLNRTYDLKAIADYETHPGYTVTAAIAEEAIQTACRFVNTIAALIPSSGRAASVTATPRV